MWEAKSWNCIHTIVTRIYTCVHQYTLSHKSNPLSLSRKIGSNQGMTMVNACFRGDRSFLFHGVILSFLRSS